MWFSRRKRKDSFVKNASDNLIAKLEGRLKNKFVRVMQAYDQKLTTRKRALYFGIYFFVMSGICISTILRPLFSKSSPSKSYRNIVILPDITLPDSLDINYLKNVKNGFFLKDSIPQFNQTK